jgi:hypothetical protein
MVGTDAVMLAPNVGQESLGCVVLSRGGEIGAPSQPSEHTREKRQICQSERAAGPCRSVVHLQSAGMWGHCRHGRDRFSRSHPFPGHAFCMQSTHLRIDFAGLGGGLRGPFRQRLLPSLLSLPWPPVLRMSEYTMNVTESAMAMQRSSMMITLCHRRSTDDGRAG